MMSHWRKIHSIISIFHCLPPQPKLELEPYSTMVGENFEIFMTEMPTNVVNSQQTSPQADIWKFKFLPQTLSPEPHWKVTPPLDRTFEKSWFLPKTLRKNDTKPTFLQWSSILNVILNSVLIAIISLFASNPLFETPIDEKKHAKDSSSLISFSSLKSVA